MPGMDGGRVAARGFQFQYVRTLEALLTSTLQAEVYACRVEGPHEPSSETRIDVVDFDLISEAGECLLAAQVKSAATGRVMSSPKAFSILVDLTSSFKARRYELITAATPDANCRKLAQALIDHGSDTSGLRNALVEILKNAPKALASLNKLDIEHLAHLCHARIVFDTREDQEIREHLHYLLREHRSRNRAGLGDRSAGLIFGYLIAEIMRRAASPEAAQWTIEDFSNEVLIEDEILTRALGRQDWGVVYGPIAPVPRIPRPDILQSISDIFFADGPDRAVPRLCAITGLSGIGKSSMAASYIAEWADRYDLIFWADAATPETLMSSFRRLLGHLIEREVEPTSLTVEYMQEQMFELLRGFSGKWLLVFDDAFQGVARGWLPRLGDGDILITSTDSAGWRHAHGRIEMTRMSRSQAVQLFKRGLSIEHSVTEAEERSIVHLVESLEGWPLAIELACGYLASCGIQLDQLSMYQSMLIDRAMDDRVSVPWGYPRTLVASILLNIDRLKQISQGGGPPFEQVSALLCGLCYFASGRIPLHLALVSVYVDPTEVPDRPALLTLMDESNAPVRELIRTLTQVSFVRYTEPLPPFNGESMPGADDTISLNSVLQDILRKVFELSFTTTELLSHCAFHANLWLKHAVETDSGERAWVIAQHAASLVKNVERLATPNNVTALLLGNLAGFYEGQGQHQVASELLVRELAWLDGMDNPNELLIFQSRIILAEIYVREENSADGAEFVVSNLSGLDAYIKKVALESESAAAFLATRASIVLETQSRISPTHSELNSLREKIDKLAGQISPTPVTAMLEGLADLNRLITEDGHEEGERLARIFLNDHSEADAIPLVAALEVRRLLIESLAYQRKWSDAAAEFEIFKPHIKPRSLHHFSIQNLIHNVGLACALGWLIAADDSAADLLDRIAKAIEISDIKQTLPDETRARFTLLEGINAAAQEDFACCTAAIAEIKTVQFGSAGAKDAETWERLLAALPGRVSSITSKTIHGHIQEYGKSILDRGRPLMESDERLQRILREAIVHAGLLSSNDAAHRIFHVSSILDTLSPNPTRTNGGFPVAILQPIHQIAIGRLNQTGLIELQIHLICDAGFRRISLVETASIPLLDKWKFRLKGTRADLLDPADTLRGTAAVQSNSSWISEADSTGRVLVFYGWGFQLEEPRSFQRLLASPEVFRDGVKEAADCGLLAAAFVPWHG